MWCCGFEDSMNTLWIKTTSSLGPKSFHYSLIFCFYICMRQFIISTISQSRLVELQYTIQYRMPCVYSWMNRKVRVCFESCVGGVFFFKNDPQFDLGTAARQRSSRADNSLFPTLRNASSRVSYAVSMFLEPWRKCIFSITGSWRSQKWNRDASMYSLRAWASAPISLCRPVQRTHWSPALPPGIKEKKNVGLQLMIIHYGLMCQLFLQFPKA